MKESAILALEDGTVFQGRGIGVEGCRVGEVVFNTAMTGYQEILTDPSYAKQLVTLTYPHIGNTGTNDEDDESDAVWAEGLIIRDLPRHYSNRRAQQSLDEYLYDREVVGIGDIDTRHLTRIIRESGALNACLMSGNACDQAIALAKARDFSGLKNFDLAQVVSTSERTDWHGGRWDPGSGYQANAETAFSVVAYDFGVKRNILRCLASAGCAVHIVPAKTTAAEVLDLNPDGVFLSNGPGDPEPCDYAITAIGELLKHHLPIFGICLGYQLLALASGAATMKMKHGHHGANHPVLELSSGRVYITSQNHGFAVDEASLPSQVEITHRSLFDQSLQGIQRTDVAAFGFQGHPEASPGPQDIQPLFEHFTTLMAQARRA